MSFARPSRVQLLSGLLLGAGAMHFAAPKPYDKIVPHALPGSPRTWTYVSGVAEIGVGAAIAMPRTRRLGGLLAALLFIAVLPANVQMAADWTRNEKMPLWLRIGSYLRLPLQIPLITSALKVRREA
ncbi:DoxX family protein [Nocardia stercoris]|uniref:DoxX family membrane protein n=1 Tax=Nocardia stercoris TaxID=2483361 RepID=A0A3M2LID7_9NOCA|nr:hypothetical protein [Nocardia stercoris]RMI35785.1 hypothetical protein EBN03_02500 [Nocardia stercoris]